MRGEHGTCTSDLVSDYLTVPLPWLFFVCALADAEQKCELIYGGGSEES